MALCKQGFTMDQYTEKSKLANNFRETTISTSNTIYPTIQLLMLGIRQTDIHDLHMVFFFSAL
jgi:hypothetical protein